MVDTDVEDDSPVISSDLSGLRGQGIRTSTEVYTGYATPWAHEWLSSEQTEKETEDLVRWTL